MKTSLLLGALLLGVAGYLLLRKRVGTESIRTFNGSSNGLPTRDTSTAAVLDLWDRVFPSGARINQPGARAGDTTLALVGAGGKLAISALSKIINAGGGNTPGNNNGYNTQGYDRVQPASSWDFQGYLFEDGIERDSTSGVYAFN